MSVEKNEWNGKLPLFKNWECITNIKKTCYWFLSSCTTDKDDVGVCPCGYHMSICENACVCLPQIWMIWNTNQMLTFWFEFSNFSKATDSFFSSFDVVTKQDWGEGGGERKMVDKQFYPTLNGVTLEILMLWFNSLTVLLMKCFQWT